MIDEEHSFIFIAHNCIPAFLNYALFDGMDFDGDGTENKEKEFSWLDIFYFTGV